MKALVMWCHWCWQQHHVMLITSSDTLIHSLDQDDENEVQHNFFWSCETVDTCMSIMMLMALSMALLHSLDYENWNDVYHDIFGHVMPLQLTLVPSMATLHSLNMMMKMRCIMSFLVIWCYWHWHQWQSKTIKMRCNMTFWSHDTSANWCWWHHQWHHFIP